MDDRTGVSAASPPADLADIARRLKAIVVGSSGNLIEWYDFYAYFAFSLYFASAFFPEGSQTAQLLNKPRRSLPWAFSCGPSADGCSGTSPTAVAADYRSRSPYS